MKKGKQLWRRIPRKTRTLIHLALLLLSVMVFYVCIGSPDFGNIHSFRRAEKAQCVGPSTIIGTVDLDGTNYDHVLLAEDQLGAYLYLYKDDRHYDSLHYREKTGDLTVIPVPQHSRSHSMDRIEVAVIVFDDLPEAVHAEITASVTASTLSSEQTYTAEAHREKDGYFCFRFQQIGWPAQIEALQILSEMGSSRPSPSNSHHSYPATLRLYDAAGQLIREESFVFRSTAGEANAAEMEVQP